ncbi:hypothetical protein ACX0GZ_05375 [Sphingomonas aestuarii]
MDSPFFFEATHYWSDGDERAHFDWLKRIGCVRGVHGKGQRLFLEIDRAVTTEDLLELKAIYHRYGGDISQLKYLEEGINAQD